MACLVHAMRYLGWFLPWYALPRKPPYPTLPRKPPAPTLLHASNACLRPYAPATAPLKYCVWWARGAGGGGDSSSSIAPALIVVVAQSAVVVALSLPRLDLFTLQSILQSRAARSSMVAAGRRRLQCELHAGVNCRGQTSPTPRLLCLIRIDRCVAPAERRLHAKRAALPS